MEASVIPGSPRAASAISTADASAIPATIYAVLFASTSVVIGVLWDISWHSTIGRDTFWSLPHLAIYAGGAAAGIACGWLVLRITFAGTEAEKAASVGWWGYFRGPLGAWTCIWGSIAMLTSGPFDDWWHNAYGLDVKILSPPHAVLALGILGIQLGALFMVLALQNRASVPAIDATAQSAERERGKTFEWLYVYAAGLILINFWIMGSEYTWRVYQHNTAFYQVVCFALILPIVAAGVGGRLRWSATATAAVYMSIVLLLVWIFPLFPAEPRLAPIRFAIRQMMPPQFPLLLIVPAIAIDLLLQRWGTRPRGWLLAGAISAAFLLTFASVQWPFADFLSSDLAKNAIFAQHLRPYMIPEDSYLARGDFIDPQSGMALLQGLTIAAGLGTISARFGLAAGSWMARVRR